MPCPDPSHLQQFAFGRLESAEEERIETHLEQCPACRERLSELERAGDDSLFQKIREANLHEVSRSEGSGDSSDLSSEHLSESLPDTIGNYKILGLLGRGGMGTVYKGLNPHLNREVAIKVVKSSRSFRESALKRFKQEMFAAGKLQHPNIVQALDAGVFENRPYLVLELLEGSDFSHYVKEHGPLSVAAACDAVRQTALGLQHAHEAGLVHRDIKPSNLWRTPDGTVKILDLGLVRFLESETRSDPSFRTESCVVAGTPKYMAPEQAGNFTNADCRSDVYSLGCTLYFLLTGETPLPLDTTKKIPEPVAPLLRKMLAAAPEDRYGTMQELVSALENRSLRERKRRFIPVWAYGGIAALIFAIALFVAWPRNLPTTEEPLPTANIEESNLPDEEDWLTTKEIADYLSVTDKTIYRWIDKNDMPAHRAGKLWRFRKSEVDDWMKREKIAEK